MNNTPPTASQLTQYGALAVPLSFAGMPLYVHAPDLYATQHGVSLASLGAVLLVLRLIDAVQDPLIGSLSDGPLSTGRLPTMVIAGAVLVISFFLLFTAPPAMPLLWFAVTLLLATTAFSVLTINLNTLGALWHSSSHDKTRITGSREALALTGLLLAVTLPAMLQNHMDATRAFEWVSLILAALMILGLSLFTVWFVRHGATPVHRRQPAPWHSLFTMSRRTRHFYLVYGLSMMASALPAVLLLFFIRDRLGGEQFTGAFLLIYFAAGIAGMPLWLWFSRQQGKYRAWLAAMALAIVSFIWAYWLGHGDFWPYAVICLLSGLAAGADLALPPAILADHIHEQQLEATATRHFSVLTFLAKSSLALGSAIALPTLAFAGFEPGGTNNDSALLGLSAAYALIPCAIKLLAAILLWRYISVFTKEVQHANPTNTIVTRSHDSA